MILIEIFTILILLIIISISMLLGVYVSEDNINNPKGLILITILIISPLILIELIDYDKKKAVDKAVKHPELLEMKVTIKPEISDTTYYFK